MWGRGHGPRGDEDEFRFHHYLRCGSGLASSLLWSISTGDKPAHQPHLPSWRDQQQNPVPLTGRETDTQVAHGAPRSPSAVQGDRDADLRAHTCPARPHRGPPTVLCAWAPPNWVLGPGPLGQGSHHLLRLWLRACVPRPLPLAPLGRSGCSRSGPPAPSPGCRADPAGVPGAATRASPSPL